MLPDACGATLSLASMPSFLWRIEPRKHHEAHCVQVGGLDAVVLMICETIVLLWWDGLHAVDRGETCVFL